MTSDEQPNTRPRRRPTMMIPHHTGAVVMGNQEVKTGTDPQLKQLAASMVSSQSQEIGQMQAMLASGG